MKKSKNVTPKSSIIENNKKSKKPKKDGIEPAYDNQSILSTSVVRRKTAADIVPTPIIK